jgi:hypothetical protein
MDPPDEQLVRLGRTGRQMPIGIVTVVVLLLVAIVKPWPSAGSAAATASPSAPVVVAAASIAEPTATSFQANRASDMCTGADGWRLVVDDIELGRYVRAWLVASVVYSMVPPLRFTIPVTSLVSSSVNGLGVCVPTSAPEPLADGWSATLWRESSDGANAGGWDQVGRLIPAPGALGALAGPLGASAVVWSPGRYVLETRFAGSIKEAWLGLQIQDSPGSAPSKTPAASP